MWILPAGTIFIYKSFRQRIATTPITQIYRYLHSNPDVVVCCLFYGPKRNERKKKVAMLKRYGILKWYGMAMATDMPMLFIRNVAKICVTFK